MVWTIDGSKAKTIEELNRLINLHWTNQHLPREPRPDVLIVNEWVHNHIKEITKSPEPTHFRGIALEVSA